MEDNQYNNKTGRIMGQLRSVWWWPAIVSSFCLLGLYVLYAYSGDIFSFMSAQTAQIYILTVATLLILVYFVSIIITAKRWLKHRREKRPSGEEAQIVNQA